MSDMLSVYVADDLLPCAAGRCWTQLMMMSMMAAVNEGKGIYTAASACVTAPAGCSR